MVPERMINGWVKWCANLQTLVKQRADPVMLRRLGLEIVLLLLLFCKMMLLNLTNWAVVKNDFFPASVVILQRMQNANWSLC